VLPQKLENYNTTLVKAKELFETCILLRAAKKERSEVGSRTKDLVVYTKGNTEEHSKTTMRTIMKRFLLH